MYDKNRNIDLELEVFGKINLSLRILENRGGYLRKSRTFRSEHFGLQQPEIQYHRW